MEKNKDAIGDLRKELNKGKKKGLGLFETLNLIFSGLKDGKYGVPKLDTGEWNSAFLNKERNSYEEYCDRVWGNLQISLNDTHIRCDVLMKEIPLIATKIDVAKSKTELVEPVQNVRKRGEENLSENQVIARRKKEAEKRLAKLQAVVDQLESVLTQYYEELAEKHHYITESTNGARLVCERVMKHSDQRIDVYWRAVHRIHPERDQMPMTFCGLLSPKAEITYMAQHKGYEEAVKNVLDKYEKEVIEIRSRIDEKESEVD